MKTSRYNIYIPQDKDSTAIYNLISGKLQCVTPRLANLVYRHGKKQIPIPRLLTLNVKEIPDLIRSGMLIEDTRDELQEYREKHLEKKFTDPIFRAVVMPTLKCNLRCDYCYELVRQFGDDSMTETMAHNIINFIENKIDSQKSSSLVFSLFGGEPLVNHKVSSLFLTSMKEICDTREIPYHFPLTTNGYFISNLREEPVMQLATSVHITLDGDKENHDKTRISLNGKPSYDKIMEGVEFLMEKGTRTIIRIHFNHLTIDGLFHILDDLQKAGMNPEKLAHLYLMNVMENPSFMFEQRCGPAQTELLESFWQQVKEYRSAIMDHPLYTCFHWETHFPTQQIELRYLSCNHESDSLFTINADGSFIKCPRFIGDDRCIIGKLTGEGDVEWTPEHRETLKISRFDNAVCQQCEYLPICGSNCVFKPLPQSLEECRDNRLYCKQQVEKYVAFLSDRPESFQTEETIEKHCASISL